MECFVPEPMFHRHCLTFPNSRRYSRFLAPSFAVRSRVRVRVNLPARLHAATSFSIATSISKSTLSVDDLNRVNDLVSKRAEARDENNYPVADALREDIEALTRIILPPGNKVEIKDNPRKHGGGSHWNIIPDTKKTIEYVDNAALLKQGDDTCLSVLQLSHSALGLATLAAEHNRPLDCKELNLIVKQALVRMQNTGAMELRGRKAADASFYFALAGVSEVTTPNMASQLFGSLAQIVMEELRRFGKRPSCRAKDIMHIVERLTASGITGSALEQLSQVAADCLETKDFKGRNTTTDNDILHMLRSNSFDLHSDRPLLWIWRFSIRQKKQRSFMKNAAKQYERTAISSQQSSAKKESIECREETNATSGTKWKDRFDDPGRPLIIDIGCGMGVSAHGLATLGDNQEGTNNDLGIDWERYNYIGVDLSRLAIGYANGVASRTGVRGTLQYIVASAEDFLQSIGEMDNVRLIMIQFPTPFKLQASDSETSVVENCDTEEIAGNSQLPKHPYSGFMVTKDLLVSARKTMQKHPDASLLLQSNVEDVAVYMRNIATEEAGLEAVPVSSCVVSLDGDMSNNRIPQRSVEYAAMGGERATGEGWSAEAFLPRRGATETEVACHLERTPVHRCMLVPSTFEAFYD